MTQYVVNKKILSILNLYPGEAKPFLLLNSFSFFLGFSSLAFTISAESLFLSQFESNQVMLAFIFGGVVTLFSSLFILKITHKLKFPNDVFFFILVIIFLNIIFLISLNSLKELKWISLILLSFQELVIGFINVAFWAVAQSIFSLQQGKRLFGQANIGDSCADIIGGFSIAFFLSNVLTVETLIGISTIGFLISLLLAKIIISKYSLPDLYKNSFITKKTKTKSTKKYSWMIFIMIFFAFFIHFYIVYIFYIETQQHTKSTSDIMRNLAWVYAFSGLLNCFINFFLTGRVISSLGTVKSLNVGPALLSACSLMSAIAFLIFGGDSIYFLFFIGFLKVASSVFGDTIGDATLQLLCKPIPHVLRTDVQFKLDTIIIPIAFIICGAFLWLISIFSSHTVGFYLCILSIILFVWYYTTCIVGKEYSERLIHEIQRRTKVFDRLLKSSFFDPGLSKNKQVSLLRCLTSLKNQYPKFNTELVQKALFSGSKETADFGLELIYMQSNRKWYNMINKILTSNEK